MLTYITAFIFYTLAMVGILLVGYIIYKKSFTNTQTQTRGLIKILDHQMISPKKSLMVVKVNNERFLIASGIEHTTFLAKLENNNEQEKNDFAPQKINENEYFTQDIQQHKQNLEQIRINNAQKQFSELYNSQSATLPNFKEMQNKKEIIKNLLSDLNESSNKLRGGF